DYAYHVSKSIFEWPTFCSLLLLIAVLICAVRLFSKYRMISFGIFFFFLALVPESSILPLKDVIFEHRLYLPLAGFGMFLPVSVYYLWGRNNFRAMVICLSAVVACYSALTYIRNNVWRDGLSLWEDTVSKSPHKARPYVGLGQAWEDKGYFAQAIADYTKAIAIDPLFADAYYNRGTVYGKLGSWGRAVSDYKKTVELNPYKVDAYYNRGTIYSRQGLFTRAIADFDKAAELDPGDADIYHNRAITYYHLKDFRRSLKDSYTARALGNPVSPKLMGILKGKSRA
ncbi:MAG: tetratricopeptide repeat protein, partial [Candidatus Omnitrophica bacterium]|nr:tetratricopeptide repeat protein [Candidatus Omnitrophota bacterium]